MTQRLPSWSVVLLAGTLLSAVSAPPADAQKVSLPPSMVASKQDTAWWTGQLRMARQIGGRALAGLEATVVDESVPIAEGVLQATRDTYVLIRSARHGMELAKGHQKFPDPLVDLNFAWVTDAWNLSRTPVDKISWSLPRQEYLDISTRDLRAALRLLDRVLVTLP